MSVPYHERIVQVVDTVLAGFLADTEKAKLIEFLSGFIIGTAIPKNWDAITSALENAKSTLRRNNDGVIDIAIRHVESERARHAKTQSSANEVDADAECGAHPS